MDTPKYMIGVAAQLVGMHPQTLRLYEAKGLVRPRRTPGGTRLYSDRDLARLKQIQRLSGELGLTLLGHRARARARGRDLAPARPRRAARVASSTPSTRGRPRTSPRCTARTAARSSSGSRRAARSSRRQPLQAPKTAEGLNMDFTKLTAKAQEAIARAQELARARGNPEMTPDHLLLAMLETPESVASQLLRKTGVDPARGPPRQREQARRPAVGLRRPAEPDAVARLPHRARQGRGGGEAAVRRLHRLRAPGARPGRDAGPGPRPAEGAGRHADEAARGAARPARRPERVDGRTPRSATARSRSSAATSPRSPRPASSTR